MSVQRHRAVLWVIVVILVAGHCMEPECLQPLEAGSCSKLRGRFFYNASAAQCQEFVWRGCTENANNFENREDCEKECLQPEKPLPRPKDGPGRRSAVCYRRPRRGNCKAIHRRWFFNYRTLMCDRFLWGGCDTNGNNFNTRRDCRLACTPTAVVQDRHYR